MKIFITKVLLSGEIRKFYSLKGGKKIMNLCKFVKHFTKAIVITIFIISFLVSSFTVSADPTVVTIVTVPANPKPLSTFTVIATITGENIIKVNVTISECTDGPPALCFKSHPNIPMALNNDGNYEAEVTLTGTQDSIDHVQYRFIINDNGTEHIIEDDLKTYLKVETDTDGTNNHGADNETPGFELFILIVSVFISITFLKRKR